jgi:transposase
LNKSPRGKNLARPTTPLNLTPEQNEYLQSLVRSREVPHSRVQRAQIILKAAAGKSHKKISQDLNLCEDTVGFWRRRWIEAHTDLSTDNPQKKLSQAIQAVLSDKPRPGTPQTYTAEQVCQILALACETPPEPLTHWTREDLAREAAKRDIVEQISPSTIGRILNEADLKPHRSQYWLNHEVEDEATFREDVRDICKLSHQAQEKHEPDVHIISVDEKTGIQAKEHSHPTHPMEQGKPEAVEYEYKRHGTQTLIANFEVATGQVISPTVSDTRTEKDFVNHIVQTVETDPEAQWIFICDQLNTHKSATLVQAIAQMCEIEDNLGIKGKSGILHTMDSRADLLSDENHHIHFVYTPKHCSWLNQVEIWFGILSRRLLRRGTFKSTRELKQRIFAFIDFFNNTLAKPFRWTYIGKPLLI